MKTFLTSIISFLTVLNIIAAPAPTAPKSAKDAKATAAATASKPAKKAAAKATATTPKPAPKAPATVAAPTNRYATITMLSETNLYEISGAVIPECQIDKIVFRKLSKMGVKPLLCSDAVFVRRAFVDVIGTIPNAKEAKDFIQDKNPNKRKALIDNLLERNEYADYWAMKWGDILKIKAEFPVNLWPNAAQAYHHWIRSSLRDNKPYDKFVREMLVSNGSNFRVGPVNFYRAVQNKTPEGLATVVALVFMGSRAENWPTNTLTGMQAFFSQVTYKPTREWKEEVVFWDADKDNTLQQEAIAAAAALATNVASSATNAVSKQATNAVAQQVTNAAPQVAVVPPVQKVPRVGIFPDGKKVKLPADRDPREIFADWLITPKNPWFTKNIVNRMWSWLLGRGIIHEPDDIRPDNPPSNPELLEYLQQEFAASHYDMKRMFRLILNSKTYQLSSINSKPGDPKAEANFAFYPLRRLDAEVLIDVIDKVTGTSDLYTSAIPEPFTFIPEGKPSVAIMDGSISSAFLELFGRPARATGLEKERANRPLATQSMYLLNSVQIQRKLETGRMLKAIMGANSKRTEIIEDIYLAILSRFPTLNEVKNAEEYAKLGVVQGRDVWIDVSWALINSEEFLYRH